MAEIRNPKRAESQAETQKLRNGERELGTQELRKEPSDWGRFAGSLSGFPDFLIRHFPVQAFQFGKSLSEFLSFGFAAFCFLLSAFGLRISALPP